MDFTLFTLTDDENCKFQPAYSTQHRHLTTQGLEHLRKGLAVDVDHVTHYFMHTHTSFVREIKVKMLPARKPMPKKRIVVKKERFLDWTELPELERSDFCENVVVDVLKKVKRHMKRNLDPIAGMIELKPLYHPENSVWWDTYADHCGFDLLLQQGIEANPGPDFLKAQLKAKNAGLFHQRTFMCALNELALKHSAQLLISPTRVIGTPDHDPRFICEIKVKFNIVHQEFSAQAEEGSLRRVRELAAKRCLEFIVADQPFFLSILSSSHWIRDLLREGIESNPGPVMSTLNTRFNEPSVLGLDVLAQMGMFKNLGRMADGVGELGELNTTIREFMSTMEHIAPMFTANIETTASSVSETISSVKDDLIKFGLIFIIIQGCFLVGAKKLGLCASLLALGYAFGFDKYLLDLIVQLTEFLSKKEEVVIAQMGIEDLLYSDCFQLVGKIIFGAMAFLCIKKIPGRQDWDNYIQRLARIPNAIDGGKKIWQMCSEYFNVALDNVKMMVLGKESTNFSVTSSYVKEIQDWMKEISRCSDLEERKKVNFDLEFQTHVSGLWAQGQRYVTDLTLPLNLKMAVKDMMFPAYQLYKFCEIAPSSGAGPKIRPTSVWFSGDSQIGKSTLVWGLCADMLQKMGYKNIDYLLYARQCETEFWDGYLDQPIVIIDDAFTKRDDKSNPNPEIQEVLRSQNNFPQHVHMASLSDKNTYLKAQMLIYTSNQEQVELESITNPEAFWNRMNDNHYRVTLKPEYAITTQIQGRTVQVMDKSKLGRKISLEPYIFQKVAYDVATKTYFEIGNPINYKQMRQILHDDWVEKRTTFSNHMEWLKERITAPWDAEAQMGLGLEWFNHNKERTYPDASTASSVSNESYDTCVDSVETIDDQIRLLQGLGRTQMEIYDFFSSTDERWELYKSYVLSKRREKSVFGILMRPKEAIAIVSEWLDSFASASKKILLKYPVFSALAILGSTLTIAYTGYKMFANMFEGEDSEQSVDRVKDLSIAKKSYYYNLAKWGVCPYCGKSDDPACCEALKNDMEGAELAYWEDAVNESSRDVYCTTELAHSGNRQQPRHKQVRVELAHSGSRVLKKQQNVRVEADAYAEACHDVNAQQIISNKVRRNCYRMNLGKMHGNVTFLKGKIFIMPYHYLSIIFSQNTRLDEIIYLSQEENDKIISFPVSHLMSYKNNSFELTENVIHCTKVNGECDLVFVQLHQQQCFPMCDITNLFISRDEQSKISSGTYSGAMLTYEHDGKSCARSYKWLGNIRSEDGLLNIILPDSTSTKYLVRGFYMYEGITNIGDCGAIVALFNPRLSHKLIGMHHAGNITNGKGMGFAVPLTSEIIHEHIARFSVEAHFALEMSDNVVDDENIVMPVGNFVSMGKSKIKVGQATKTVLRKSLFYGKLREPIKKPSNLKPFILGDEIVDPLMEGLKKCGGNCPVLDNSVLSEINSVLLSSINSQYVPLLDPIKYSRFLTYQEAVVGAEDDFMRSINRTTSAGFPWCTFSKKLPGKQAYLGKDEVFDADPSNFKTVEAKELYDAVNSLLEDCANGILRNVICVDTKKDELRPLNKTSTRIFSACPQHFVIAFRMYYLPFCAWIMHNRHHNNIAVGVNPFDVEWDVLATMLQRKGKKVIAGDFSNFDGSLNSQILWSIFHEIFIPWIKYRHGNLSSRDYNICFGLWSHVTHSVHIFDDNVYMWTHSQPSGNPMTAILNSLYNNVVMRYAWNIIMRDTKYVGQQKFSQHVYMVAYGDDNLLNISDEICELYNQQTITEALLSIGHTYTDEAKTGECIKYRSLENVQFLKRGFKRSPELQRYVAPLDEAVIYEMLNWTRVSKSVLDPHETLLTNIDVALREIVYHGKESYTNLAAALKQNFHLLPQDRIPFIRPYMSLLLDVSLGNDVEDFSYF
jgi:hypothetical protein